MVVKALDAVVIDTAVMRTRRLVEVACVIVARDDPVVVDHHFLGSEHVISNIAQA